jgi:hypothetical protein
MEYIDIHGNIHQLINTTHILHINEQNDIVKIIKFSKKLIYLQQLLVKL